jgi:hypothetical protein
VLRIQAEKPTDCLSQNQFFVVAGDHSATCAMKVVRFSWAQIPVTADLSIAGPRTGVRGCLAGSVS